MLFCDFHANLKKLNPYLRVDVNREVTPYHSEFRIAGLYLDAKYLMAVPHNYVPEWSIEEEDTQRILAPGYRVILSRLCKLGHINQQKAERLFHCNLEPNRPPPTFPKQKISFAPVNQLAN